MFDNSVLYWIEVLCSLQSVAFIVSFILILTLAATVIAYIDCNNSNTLRTVKRRIKILIILIFLFVIPTIAIPSKEIMYLMLVNSKVTEENISYGADTLKETFDYIIDRIDDMVNNSDQ